MLRSERLLPLAEVLETTGLSRSTVYSEMRKGRFPVAVKIGDKCVRGGGPAKSTTGWNLCQGPPATSEKSRQNEEVASP